MPINQKKIEGIAAEITANAYHNHHLLQFNLDQHVRKQKIYPHITIKMYGLFAQTCTKAETDTAFLPFFSFEVIGAVLAASTTVDGQCYKLGLSKMNVEKGPDRWDGLFCRHPIGIPPKLAPIRNKLGRTMFVNPYNGDSIFLPFPARYSKLYNKNGALCGNRGAWAARRLENLCRAKTSVLEKLCDHAEKRRRLDV